MKGGGRVQSGIFAGVGAMGASVWTTSLDWVNVRDIHAREVGTNLLLEHLDNSQDTLSHRGVRVAQRLILACSLCFAQQEPSLGW